MLKKPVSMNYTRTHTITNKLTENSVYIYIEIGIGSYYVTKLMAANS